MDSSTSGQDGTTPATGTPLVHSPGIGSVTCVCGAAMQRSGPLWVCPDCHLKFSTSGVAPTGDIALHSNKPKQSVKRAIPAQIAAEELLAAQRFRVADDGIAYSAETKAPGDAAWTPADPMPILPLIDAIKRAHEWPTANPGTAAKDVPPRGTPKTPEFAEALTRQIDPAYAAAREKFGEVIEQAVVADAQRRAAAARAHIAERLSTEIALHLEGHRGVDPGMVTLISEAATDAALDVFTDILRDPPSFVTYPDGTEKIEQR